MNKAADGIKVIPRSKVSKKDSQAGMLAGSGAETKALSSRSTARSVCTVSVAEPDACGLESET